MKLKGKYVKLNTQTRLYHLNNPIIGLSGGIATGKSMVSTFFKKKGGKVVCADALVRTVYKKRETIEFVKDLGLISQIEEVIDFKQLRKAVFENKNKKLKEKLEHFIYSHLPMAFKEVTHKCSPEETIVYDVPLLFEKGLQGLVDISICVYCPIELQKERLLKRDGIDLELAEKMIDNQLPIEKKREDADFIIENMKTLKILEENTRKLIATILSS